MSSNSDIILAPGETGVEQGVFSPNIVLAWLQTKIVVTNRRIVAKQPNTLLGIIPLGYQETAMPIGAVAGVNVDVKFRALRGVVGFILAVVGLIAATAGGGATFLGLILLVLGVLMILTSVSAALNLTNSGGGVQTVMVSVLQKAKLEEFRDHINASLYSGGAGAGHGSR